MATKLLYALVWTLGEALILAIIFGLCRALDTSFALALALYIIVRAARDGWRYPKPEASRS